MYNCILQPKSPTLTHRTCQQLRDQQTQKPIKQENNKAPITPLMTQGIDGGFQSLCRIRTKDEGGEQGIVLLLLPSPDVGESFLEKYLFFWGRDWRGRTRVAVWEEEEFGFACC